MSVLVPVKPVFKRRIKLLLALSTMAATCIFAPFEPAMAQEMGAQPGGVKTAFSIFTKPEVVQPIALQGFLDSGRVGDEPFGNVDVIRAFYAQRKNEPFWVGTPGAHERAQEFAMIIGNSWTHGLNPARYHFQEISDRLKDQDKVLQAELEIYLTDAAIKYAQDMTGQRLQGQVPPGEVPPSQNALKPLEILDGLEKSPGVKQSLEGLEPKSATYAYLRKELVELTGKPEDSYAAFLPISFEGIMRPGMWAKDMPKLRGRLSSPVPAQDLTKYDSYLADAVKTFQRESGLKDDGIIGEDTLVALNRTNKDRIAQLKVNMERLRWMEGRAKPEKFVVVNIPAATLWAVDKGAVAFEMPVIVGRPERPTPALVTEITGVRFNPDWTVPPTIKKEDILPKLREDPMYLTNKGIELVYRGENGRETIDPAAIDWNTITSRELHSFEMVQGAGDANPLGHVRVLMPNPYSIYLHDTNQRDYFDKYSRALSSGCIRMKEPLKVADFIMSGEKGWSMEKVNEVIAQGRTSDRLIANKIPVYILYYTVWMDDQGRVVFGRDIYGRDKALEALLEKVDGTSLAGHNIVMDNKEGKELATAQPKD